MNAIREHRLERESKCDCAQCHFCDAWLARSHEHDHFLIPKAAGGAETVPICVNCHDLKDRTNFSDWPIGLSATGVLDLIRSHPAVLDHYDFDALQAGLLPDGWVIATAIVDRLGDLESAWSSMSFPARLVYAKARRLKHEWDTMPSRVVMSNDPSG